MKHLLELKLCLRTFITLDQKYLGIDEKLISESKATWTKVSMEFQLIAELDKVDSQMKPILDTNPFGFPI